MSIRLPLMIGIGGAIGATARYSVALLPFLDGFPYPTLLVNLVGCFLLAYVANSVPVRNRFSAPVHTAITTGIIGSFTTFSTVSVETVVLLEDSVRLAMIYILLNVIGGLTFCFVGYKLATRKVDPQ